MRYGAPARAPASRRALGAHRGPLRASPARRAPPCGARSPATRSARRPAARRRSPRRAHSCRPAAIAAASASASASRIGSRADPAGLAVDHRLGHAARRDRRSPGARSRRRAAARRSGSPPGRAARRCRRPRTAAPPRPSSRKPSRTVTRPASAGSSSASRVVGQRPGSWPPMSRCRRGHARAAPRAGRRAPCRGAAGRTSASRGRSAAIPSAARAAPRSALRRRCARGRRTRRAGSRSLRGRAGPGAARGRPACGRSCGRSRRAVSLRAVVRGRAHAGGALERAVGGLHDGPAGQPEHRAARAGRAAGSPSPACGRCRCGARGAPAAEARARNSSPFAARLRPAERSASPSRDLRAHVVEDAVRGDALDGLVEVVVRRREVDLPATRGERRTSSSPV